MECDGFSGERAETRSISCHDSKDNTIEIAKRIRDFGFALVKDLHDVSVEEFVKNVTSHPPRSTNYGDVYEVRHCSSEQPCRFLESVVSSYGQSVSRQCPVTSDHSLYRRRFGRWW